MRTFSLNLALCSMFLALISTAGLAETPVDSAGHCLNGEIDSQELADKISEQAREKAKELVKHRKASASGHGKGRVAEALLEAQPREASEFLRTVVDKAPTAAPVAKQLVAPSRVADSPSLVDDPLSTVLLALAPGNDLLDFDEDSLTLSLNAFGFVSAFRPQVLDRQSLYQNYEDTRRWSGSVTFGGEGEKFDRDGDGEDDDPLKSESYGDIITWEVQYRFGSRDRRDRQNYEPLFRTIEQDFDRFAYAHIGFVDHHSQDLDRLINHDTECYPEAEVEELIEQSEFLQNVAEAVWALDETLRRETTKIDNAHVVSLVVGGTSREEQFGPDKQLAALRGSWRNFTWNAEWQETEGLMGAEDPVTWKAGLKYAWLWHPPWVKAQEGVEVSLSGSYEMFDDVPEARHDTNAKLNAKLELPLGKAIKIPISVTWANHEDLLTDEEEVRGHVGFTIDTAKLFEIGSKD